MMEFVRWATSTCTSLIQEYVIQQTHHTTGIIAQITSVNLCKVSNIMILTVGCCVGPDMNYRSKASVSIQETQPESQQDRITLYLVLCLFSDSEERLVND